MAVAIKGEPLTRRLPERIQVVGGGRASHFEAVLHLYAASYLRSLVILHAGPRSSTTLRMVSAAVLICATGSAAASQS